MIDSRQIFRKQKQVAVILSACLTMLFATSCFKNLVCADATDYFFSIYADLTPNTPTIHIGDTLWISITTPVTLKDNSSGENINFAGALNLSEGIGFEKIHGTDSISHAANNFHYYLIKGSPVKKSTCYATKGI